MLRHFRRPNSNAAIDDQSIRIPACANRNRTESASDSFQCAVGFHARGDRKHRLHRHCAHRIARTARYDRLGRKRPAHHRRQSCRYPSPRFATLLRRQSLVSRASRHRPARRRSENADRKAQSLYLSRPLRPLPIHDAPTRLQASPQQIRQIEAGTNRPAAVANRRIQRETHSLIPASPLGRSKTQRRNSRQLRRRSPRSIQHHRKFRRPSHAAERRQ